MTLAVQTVGIIEFSVCSFRQIQMSKKSGSRWSQHLCWQCSSAENFVDEILPHILGQCIKEEQLLRSLYRGYRFSKRRINWKKWYHSIEQKKKFGPYIRSND